MFRAFSPPPFLCGANLVLISLSLMAELARDVSVCHKLRLHVPSATTKTCFVSVHQYLNNASHRMIGYVMLFKADKLKYNGLSCLVAGWCNCPVCPKNWSDNGIYVLACRLLINGRPSTVFGVLDIHNLLLWLFGVDIEIMWHILVPTLDGSNSLSQVSGLNNGKWWHDD